MQNEEQESMLSSSHLWPGGGPPYLPPRTVYHPFSDILFSIYLSSVREINGGLFIALILPYSSEM